MLILAAGKVQYMEGADTARKEGADLKMRLMMSVSVDRQAYFGSVAKTSGATISSLLYVHRITILWSKVY